jgi:hypothetical protein|tara:strand:- start:1547 stop:1741 length:195 start_codon:yes stop_codon:yes gene_type:complete
VNKTFVKKMMDSQRESLPENNFLLAQGYYYQITVDVFLPENQEGKTILVGDKITRIGTVKIQEK